MSDPAVECAKGSFDRLVCGGEDGRFARVALTLHPSNDPIPDVSLHHPFEREYF